MLSFFSKKKHSPERAEEVIQGPGEAQQNNADDFIFVEKKPTDDPTKVQHHIYPPMPPAFGIGALPYPPGPSGSGGAAHNTPTPYVQDVPFVMAPQLCNKNTFELTQLQVDRILAVITRQMSVDEQEDYNFTLEHSIQNECY